MRLTLPRLPRLPRPRSLQSAVAGGMLAAALLIAIGGAFVIGLNIPRPEPAGAPATADAGTAATMYTCSMHPQVRLPDPNANVRSASWTSSRSPTTTMTATAGRRAWR